MSVHVGTLETIIHGGIGLSVPAAPGDEVESGHRFKLHHRPDKEWLEWQTSVAAPTALPVTERPTLLPARLTWVHDGFINRKKSQSGWVLPISNGILGPRNLLTVPDNVVAGKPIELRVADHSIRPLEGTNDDWLVTVPMPENPAAAATPVRQVSSPEDAFLLTAPNQEPVFLSAVRFSPDESGRFLLDESLPLDEDDHGGVILAASDGAIIGVLYRNEDIFMVLPIDAASMSAQMSTNR